MRASRLLLGVAVVTSFGVTACSSVAQTSGTQTLNVVVQGSSAATCSFQNDTVHEQGHFPGSLTVARSHNDLQADCTGDGNRHVTFVVPASITKASPVSGVMNSMLPATSYDAATGGVYAYPDPVTVDFREIGEGANTTSDAMAPSDVTRVEMRGPTAAVTPVKMQPIVDGTTTTHTTTTTTRTKTYKAPVTSKTHTTTTVKAVPGEKMQPVASPEDKMGADPHKAKAAAKAKAEAVKKAKEAAAAKKREAADAAAAAKKAAEDAKAAADTVPVIPATPAPAAPEPAATTTTTTTTVAPAPVAPVPSADTAPTGGTTPPSSTTTTTTTAPAAVAPAPGGSDMDKYLKGQ